MNTPLRMAILLMDGSLTFSICPAAFFVEQVNEAARSTKEPSTPLIQLDFVSGSRRPYVTTAEKIRVQPTTAMTEVPYSCILVPAIEPGSIRQVIELVELHRDVVDWLRFQSERGAFLCTANGGIFLVAESGLLDNKRVAVATRYAREISRRYPRIIPDTYSSMTEETRFICATRGAGTFALPLRIISRLVGPSYLERLVHFVGLVNENENPDCAIYSLDGFSSHNVYSKAVQWMRLHLRDDIQLNDVAEVACVSQRTLLRHFKLAVGMAPLAYLRVMRLDLARDLLVHTTLQIKEIAEAVGYKDYKSFARQFSRRFGVKPHSQRHAGTNNHGNLRLRDDDLADVANRGSQNQ